MATDETVAADFERMRDNIGENPAHFLDQPLFTGDDGCSDPVEMIRDRIRGIDRLAVLACWTKVEEELGRTPAGGRDRIMEMLADRREFLVDHGERPVDLQTEWPQDLPNRYQPYGDREVPPKECHVIRRDGERVPYEDRPTTASVGRSVSSSTTASADGGEPA